MRAVASASNAPISGSPPAAWAAMRASWSGAGAGRERASSSSQTAATARSMPRCSARGFSPDDAALTPSASRAWVRTIAVVVPSPTASLVRQATSRSA